MHAPDPATPLPHAPPPRPLIYSPPRHRILRWLTDPGPQVEPEIHGALLSLVFMVPRIVLMGVANTAIVNSVALLLGGGPRFLACLVLDLVLAAVRLTAVRRAATAAARGRRTPTDLYLVSAICWSMVQGTMCMLAMLSGNHMLELVGAVTGTGAVGVLCARNYAAPRYALLLVCLVHGPFLLGGALSGEPWMFVLVVQTLPYTVICWLVIRQLHSMAVALLTEQRHSQFRSEHDALTGLLNRAGLMGVLARLQADATRRFVLFYLDLDGFKAVNDNYGHPAGDVLLVEVARRLSTSLRAGDTIARLGGDEFVVVATDLAPEEGAALAEAIIRRITDQAYPLGLGAQAHIGVSIGFACAPEDGVALQELQGKADVALYRAKRAGKGVSRRFSQQVEDAAAWLPEIVGGLASG